MIEGLKLPSKIIVMFLSATTAASIVPICLAEEFVVDDQVVSYPFMSLVDPEYNQRELSLAWADAVGNLWLAHLDPVTGDLLPKSGRGELIDTGLASNNDVLNGAEWIFSKNTAYILYNKRLDNNRLELHIAHLDLDLGWHAEPLAGGLDFYRGVGTSETNTSYARLIALRDDIDGNTYRHYRYLFIPETERRIDEPTLRGARFVENQNGIVATAVVDNVQQVVYQKLYSNTPPVPLSSDGGNKSLPMMWWAPEFQEYLFFVNIDTQALGLYRFIDNAWTLYYKVQLPTALPFVQFPRLLVYKGHSYVVLVAAEKLVNGPGGQWIGLPAGECEIWLVGIDPDQPLLRKVSDTSLVAVRTDPEVVILQDGPVVYYSQWNNNYKTFILRRAATGL